MYAWEAIQNAIDDIEKHLDEEIDIKTLSEQVGLSPFYFQRLFKRLVNRPLQEYIKLRRLAASLQDLDKGDRIIDIAQRYQFSSHGAFTRAFKESFHITPKEYREKKPLLNTFERALPQLKHLNYEEGMPIMFQGIVLEIQCVNIDTVQRYIGICESIDMKQQLPLGETTGIDVPGMLWQQFHKVKENIESIIDMDTEIGMSYMQEKETNTFTYFAGAQKVKKMDIMFDGFIEKKMPAGKYLICRIEADNVETLRTAALDSAYNYIFEVWLKKHHRSTSPFSIEKYIRGDGELCTMELMFQLIDA